MGMGRIQLLDYNGCPVHTQIVGPQSREVVHGSLSIFFHFKVFKFPDVNNVYFVCEIKICYKKCQQPNCGLFTANKHKRRRRSLSELYSPEIPLHEIHNSSLIYGKNSTKLKNALNKTALNNSEINLKVDSRDSINNFPITNSIEGVKTSTIFQSIMVKIPLEQDEGEEQVNNNDIHPLLSHTGPKDNKSFSYEADEDHLSADDENAIEISGQEVHEKTIGYRDGGVLRKSALAEKREVCVSKTAFATSLGSLFAFVIIITTFAFYQLSKRQLKKFSSKLSSFDNQEYYENSCEKDSRQILPFDFGSVRSNGGNTAFQQTSFDGINKCEVVNKDADITAKNTFPLRIKSESVYKS